MHSIERPIIRSVSNKYFFFKSINLIENVDQYKYDPDKCDLTFQFFQFKIHFNLKSDYENELFYEKCRGSLVKKSNSYNRNYWKCFERYLFPYEDKELEKATQDKSLLVKLLTNYVFYLLMALILSILVPGYCLVCNHLYLDFKHIDETRIISKDSRSEISIDTPFSQH